MEKIVRKKAYYLEESLEYDTKFERGYLHELTGPKSVMAIIPMEILPVGRRFFRSGGFS